MMHWNEIILTTSHEASEALTEMLMRIGAAGVTIEDPHDIRLEVQKQDSLDYADPKFLENLGTDVLLKAYFPQTRSLGELIPEIKEKIAFISQFLDIGKGIVETQIVNEEDWANAWKKYYTTFDITDNIVIKPSWESYDNSIPKLVIELDPGMAFGTGTHETTKMCAELVEKYLPSQSHVLDVGTGSGILSIIAAKLGAKSVVAMDIDPLAVKVAKENATINGVIEQVSVYTGVLEAYAGEKGQVIVANIIADVIVSIAPDVKTHIQPNGFFIASGIIKDRQQDVMDCYQEAGFHNLEVNTMGEWVAMVFTCPDTL